MSTSDYNMKSEISLSPLTCWIMKIKVKKSIKFLYTSVYVI